MASYGISITTLEEVFLAVGDGKDVNEHALEKQNVRKKIQAAQRAQDSDVATAFTEEGAGGDRSSLLDEEMTLSERKKLKRDKQLEDYTIAD